MDEHTKLPDGVVMEPDAAGFSSHNELPVQPVVVVKLQALPHVAVCAFHWQPRVLAVPQADGVLYEYTHCAVHELPLLIQAGRAWHAVGSVTSEQMVLH